MNLLLPAKQLTAGCFFDLDSDSGYGHFIGGEHVYSGATCPNCQLPLMLHCSLDLRDPVLGVPDNKINTLPLMYCMRCPLSWHEFSYRVLSNSAIRICEAFDEDRYLQSNRKKLSQWTEMLSNTRKEWESLVGFSSFPCRTLGFRRYPDRLQQLFNESLTNGLTPQQMDELRLLLTGYSRQKLIVPRPINQMGGIPYCTQGIPKGFCIRCLETKKKVRAMRFLLSLTNEPLLQLKFSAPSVQILFLFCPKCYTVTVINRI